MIVGAPIPADVRKAVTEGLAQFAVVWPRNAHRADVEAVVTAYCSALADMSPKAIERSVVAVLRECTYWPKPKEWRDAAKAEARAIYEASLGLELQQERAAARPEAFTAPTADRLAAHTTFFALAVEYGDGLTLIDEADPQHADVWRAAWTNYQQCSTAADDFPTLDQLRAFLAAGGADLRILDAAIARRSLALRTYGVGTTPSTTL